MTHIKFDIKMLIKLNKIFELINEYFIKRLISDRKRLQLVRNYFGGYATILVDMLCEKAQ